MSTGAPEAAAQELGPASQAAAGPPHRNGRRTRALLIVAVLLVVAALVAATGVVLLRSRTTEDAAPTPGAVQRLSAGSLPLTDAQGRAWSPALGLIGGVEREVERPVTGTASPALYQHFREGISAWDVPVPAPGRYAVDLLLAEFDVTQPGERVFDVLASGGGPSAPLVRSLDLAAGFAGVGRARHVTGIVTVTAGVLHLDFAASAGKAVASALVLSPVQGAGAVTVQHDTFDGAAGTLPAGWVPSVAPGASGDLQAYTTLLTNGALDGAGHLAVTARNDPFFFDGGSAQFTSARLVTERPLPLGAGRVQVRLRVPAGAALDASLALAPVPDGAAYDIVRTSGDRPRRVTAGRVGDPETTGQLTLPGTLAGVWHVVTADLQPGAVTFSIDGAAYLTLSDVDQRTEGASAFSGSLQLELSLAVRQRAGTPTTPFPAKLVVDDVLVTS